MGQSAGGANYNISRRRQKKTADSEHSRRVPSNGVDAAMLACIAKPTPVRHSTARQDRDANGRRRRLRWLAAQRCYDLAVATQQQCIELGIDHSKWV